MAAPAFRSVGTVGDTNGPNTTPGLPAGWQQNDVFLLICQTQNEVVAAPAGYAEAADSPQFTTASPVNRVTVFWKRATSSESAPVVNNPGNHIYCHIEAYSGCITSGNPWDVTAGQAEATATTTVTLPGDTTTVIDCLIVGITADAIDNASSARYDSWTNADLTSVSERFDGGTVTAAGGGLGVVTGVKATAGAFGNTTATKNLVAHKNSGIVLALRPPPATAADHLGFGTQPPNAAEDTAMASFTVEARKPDNSVDTTVNTGTATIAFGQNPGGGTPGGTLTRDFVSGVATFNNVTVPNPGTGYTFIATASAGYTQIESNTFNITPAPATHLQFGQQPTSTQTGVAISPAVTIRALNTAGELDTGFTGTITISKIAGAGTLGGTVSVAAVAGIATFSNLTISAVGTGQQLRASSGALTVGDSQTFTSTQTPPASKSSSGGNVVMGYPLTLRV